MPLFTRVPRQMQMVAWRKFSRIEIVQLASVRFTPMGKEPIIGNHAAQRRRLVTRSTGRAVDKVVLTR